MNFIAKNDAEIFQRAFSFVSDKSRFLQDGFMREPPFDPENPVGPERACSLGWLIHCGADSRGQMSRIFEREARLAGEIGGLTEFSDTRSHAEVVEFWRNVGKKYRWLTEETCKAA